MYSLFTGLASIALMLTGIILFDFYTLCPEDDNYSITDLVYIYIQNAVWKPIAGYFIHNRFSKNSVRMKDAQKKYLSNFILQTRETEFGQRNR